MDSKSPQRRAHGFTRQQLAEHVRRERPRARIGVDVLAPVVSALVFVLLPLGLSVGGRIIGALLMVAVAPIDRLVVWRRLPRQYQNLGLVAVRVAVSTGFVVVLPELWYPQAVLLACLVVGMVPAEPRPRLLGLLAAISVVLATTGIAFGIRQWYVCVAMLVIATIATEQWFRQFQSTHVEVIRRHDEMVDRAHMFSWEIDADNGRILSLAGNVHAVLGYTADELVGKNVSTIMTEDWKREIRGLSLADDEKHVVRKVLHRDGRILTVRNMRLATDSRHTLRGVSVDITELADASEALRYQAEHDQLTGLANRQVLERMVTDALGHEGTNVALILGDLDRFKEVNDTLGHPTGDRLLCVLANRFAHGLADLDVIARLGGDEFAFALSGDVDQEQAVEIANRIYQLALDPIAVDGVQLAVACSVGVAVSPRHGTTYEDLLKHADIATYQAKLSLGGVQVFESAPNELSVQRLEMVSEVPRAIAGDEFELHVQPKVDLLTGEMVGVEGLARWRHPRSGLLMPGAFLNVIEVAADYHRFTDVMLAQALEFTAKAKRLTGNWCPVAVNIGSMSFLDRGLPERLDSLLRASGIPGEILTLEVTESELLDEDGADLPVFAAVKSLGIRLSIDDFGTGYSSLTRLRALDVDEVKIDREFVQGLGRDPEDEIIVKAVVELAGLLGHAVVAEGVETPEQADMLRAFGCSTGQGFYFSRPQPPSVLLDSMGAEHIYEVSASA